MGISALLYKNSEFGEDAILGVHGCIQRSLQTGWADWVRRYGRNNGCIWVEMGYSCTYIDIGNELIIEMK